MLYKKQFTAAAKKIIKIGIRSNVFTLAAQLLVWEGQCVYKIQGFW